MKVSFCNDITGNKELEFNRNAFSNVNLIYYNGNPMEKVGKNTYMIYSETDGNHKAYVTGNEFTGIKILFDNHTFSVLRKLNFLEYILVLLPVFLVFIGGAIGGACAGFAAVFICYAVRNFKNIFVKTGIALLISGAAYGIWFIINSLLHGTI